MLDLNRARVLREVARLGSMTAAARWPPCAPAVTVSLTEAEPPALAARRAGDLALVFAYRS
ncbi:hypothetical protein [Actinomadura rugatobispora]|uniref:Uncharacterized protein n=1 Tax=Actinomadura rugatobispora TaxID=1994 RepID=A0ABW1ACP1_9ACTN|nr:hypothetical protein GCM10010200_099360 [Actinomadura rugatobispora]